MGSESAPSGLVSRQGAWTRSQYQPGPELTSPVAESAGQRRRRCPGAVSGEQGTSAARHPARTAETPPHRELTVADRYYPLLLREGGIVDRWMIIERASRGSRR
jgi:hypothetical protein